MRWLRCYLLMLERLQAEEALTAVAVARAGDSWTDASVRKSIVGAWQASLPRVPVKRLTPEQFAERMSMMGMEQVQ